MDNLHDVLDEVAGSPDAPDLAAGAWRRAQQQRRRNTGFVIAGTAAAVLVVVLIGANVVAWHSAGGSPVGPALGPTDTTSAPPTPQPTPPPARRSAVPTPPASTDSSPVGAGGVASFHSPSGNITCALTSTSAECTLDQDWPLTAEQQRSCEPAALEGADLESGLPARFLCATDVLVNGGSQPLEYGQSVSRGTFTCTSATTGMSCRDRASGHAFTISREEYSFS